MKIKSIAIVSVLLLAQTSFAQKIKYKDLFPILNAKNYAEGGPQLVQFLADPKNQDDPNPVFQMGLMIEDRFLKYDVEYDTTKLYSAADSAITYLERAKVLITEKEVKRNDEYYQAFFRRDLRTGDFGIKVSDVHLDIEKKVEAIQNRVSDVQSMNRKIMLVEKNHDLALNAYKSLTDKYKSYNEMLLSANEDDQALISEVELKGGQASSDAASIKELAQKLGSDRYQSEVELKPITSFGGEELTSRVIYSGSLSLWDFEAWAREVQSELRGGVGLFKIMITNYSQEIREKKAKVQSSKDAEIGDFPEDLKQQFQKYDPASTVEKLLKVEMYEARVIKYVDLQINPALMDSSRIGSQLDIYSMAKVNVEEMNLLVESITNDDLQAAKGMYPDYINSFFKKYGTASKYVQDMRDWSRRNKQWIGASVDFWAEQNRWGISGETGERRIPLFEQETPEGGFLTMKVVMKSIPEIIVYGADMESKMGYVASFGEDRVETWKLDFPLPGVESFQYTYDSLPTASGATSFYVYNRNAAENNFTAVSFNSSGQLNWATAITINKAPVDFKFDDLTQELTILLYPEEQLPLDSDELGYVVIDRTGNAR